MARFVITAGITLALGLVVPALGDNVVWRIKCPQGEGKGPAYDTSAQCRDALADRAIPVMDPCLKQGQEWACKVLVHFTRDCDCEPEAVK